MGPRFYQDPCYQLDNLAADFRYHRQGIGESLVRWGLDKARRLKLDPNTEASPMGEGLYKRLGFEQVGSWTVKLSEDEKLVMPVMRYDVRA